jgi:phosphatidate cytidylyltransferase
MMLILAALFGGLLIPYLFATIINLRLMDHGRILVMLPVICAFATDAGAYFVGVLLGKNKPFPRISPNKTLEGYIGGIIIGTLSLTLYGAGIILFTSIEFINFVALLIYGFLGAAICELGDLAFSLMKRELKVKDFGNLLPGHGGILDRFDSMVFTAPAIFTLVLVIPVF